MSKHRSFFWVLTLLAAGPAGSAEQRPSASPADSAAYFATPFQSESQFIVEAVVSDLAEQMCYAAAHRLPDKKSFLVTATEKAGSPLDAPAYDVRVRLAPNQSEVKCELSINGPIWSPTVYQALAGELGRATGLSKRSAGKPRDTTLLSKLLDGAADTIEDRNLALSAALEQDFSNPELHEDAALLLGAFLLRDHSGRFHEVRSPLSRMTAHLAMARFLRGADGYNANGRMAEAMLLTMIGNEAPAMERLKAIGTNDSAAAAMARALRTLNTGDYRALNDGTNRSPVERAAWFAALAYYTGTVAAWEKLEEEQKQGITFIRIAREMGYSIEIGHALLEASLPLELQEIRSVYERSTGKELAREGVVKALNELPERCFNETGGNAQVRVIGWGQWAAFLQRHLCYAVQQDFSFMNCSWSVPDQARSFGAQCERDFGTLRLYPFVRRFNCTDVEGYHKSVDDGYRVTVATPHLVPAACWNELGYKVRFAPLYSPIPNPHLNEWHSHNPPPGTVYDVGARLAQPSLSDRPDALARLEKLRELAPSDFGLVSEVAFRKYRGRPTYAQAMALYGPLLPYSAGALQRVAGTVTNQPEQYEKLMLQAGRLNPACYYPLCDYFLKRKQEDKGAEYLDKACAADPDTVRVANHSRWRVWYYLKKGQTDKAREIADQAAETYCANGLEAKAKFLEATTNYVEALEWYTKIEERYGHWTFVVDFCFRYKAETGDTRFDPEVEKRLGKLFPKGLEKVGVRDLHGPPTDGVSIEADNDLLKAAGLKAGDVIVAVYGVRVHNMRQYLYGRDLKQTPELDLIVWHGDAYREHKPSPPHHRFGVQFTDYVAKSANSR